MKQKKFHAWGIDLNTNEGHSLVGRYWQFKPGHFVKPPIHLEGCHAALFDTRKIARENLKHVKSSVFPKARVVKVNVTLEWE